MMFLKVADWRKEPEEGKDVSFDLFLLETLTLHLEQHRSTLTIAETIEGATRGMNEVW